MSPTLQKIVNILFSPYNTLIIGAFGVLLTFIGTFLESDPIYFIGLGFIGIVAIIVVILIIFAWIINPIRNLKKENKDVS